MNRLDDLFDEVDFVLKDQTHPLTGVRGTAEMVCGALFLRFDKYDRLLYVEVNEGELGVEVYNTGDDNDQLIGRVVVSLPVKAEV